MLDVKLRHPLNGSSNYCGPCDVYGRRDGLGSEYWKDQDQGYAGAFVRDAYHGEGVYTWLTGKERLVFEGHFYSNFKEGYGLVSLPDGSCFEGLFCNNRPFGPGVRTHVNGRQDVGFWSGRRIVRLSRPVDFIIPRLATTAKGKLKLLQFQKLLPFVEENGNVGAALLVKHGCDPGLACRLYSNFIHDPRSLFFNRMTFDKVFFVKVPHSDLSSDSPSGCEAPPSDGEYREGAGEEESAPPRSVPSHCLCKTGEFLLDRRTEPEPAFPEMDEDDLPVGLLQYYLTNNTLDGLLPRFPGEKDRDDFEEESRYGEVDYGEGRSPVTHLISWNRTESCMEMLKEIFRFRAFEDGLTFKISDLMAGARCKFRKTGEQERACMHFLKMCSLGPPYVVRELLCSGEISEALMDARGNNCIMFAAATDQRDVIDILLNHGADVNSFNDENLTPLNFCLLRRIAQAECLGNWEAVFLNPEDSSLTGTGNRRTWRVNRSIESLDRIFGDGMSARSSCAGVETARADENESVFCTGSQGEFDEEVSDVTLLDYAKDEVVDGGGTNVRSCSQECVPSSWKREEFLRSVAAPTESDKYFFDLTPQNKKTATRSGIGSFDGSLGETDPNAVADRVARIDRTIELLLMRGADPNLADAPKPSLHLAVYSRELSLVRLLLMYGASPDSQSLPQEGLLTPLHLLVLMKPGQEPVDICRLLLNHGASPEEETSPLFDSSGDDMLDPDHGRTPLQLLCMRKDAQYVDPEGFLGQLAILLATVSKRRHFFKGHSWVTLAMMTGNLTLVRVLLGYKKMNPNEALGKGLGTALHVLVSTEMQRRTSYEDSIRMCDMLLESGGDPDLQLRKPDFPAGTVVEYGYREIEMERRRRRETTDDASSSDLKRSDSRKKTGAKDKDYLDDHVRVVEYLASKSKLVTEGGGGGGGKSEAARKADAYRKRKGNAERTDTPEIEDSKETKKKGGKKPAPSLPDEKDESVPRKREMGKMKKPRDEGGGAGKDRASNEEKTKIVEIKKHVAIAREKGSRKRAGGKKEEATRKDAVGRKYGKVERVDGLRFGSKDRGSSAKGSSTFDRLPERFRRSLLHMYGFCSDRFDLNDLLLPYVVLRNGDLYYRFKGQKPARTEQYSLI